jgi:geranylgeranyl pyrophosphate synthase
VIDLDALLRAEATVVGERLEVAMPRTDSAAAPRLVEAMRYSLLAGGKRLRPVLCLWIHEATGQSRTEATWAAAIALEMLHTYSLVHDDLPAMDDDDLRRGQPSCHRRFDEATAILAGDTLQTAAFGVLASAQPAELAVRLVECLASAAGADGMAAGQQLDLDATGGAPEGDPTRIHRLKTGRLLGASTAMGALCAGLDPTTIERVRVAGEDLGIAFQVVDDVLDHTVSATQMGKTTGKDAAQGKLTAVGAWGIERARAQARERLELAVGTLRACGVLDERVEALARRLVDRSR